MKNYNLIFILAFGFFIITSCEKNNQEKVSTKSIDKEDVQIPGDRTNSYLKTEGEDGDGAEDSGGNFCFSFLITGFLLGLVW